VHDRSWLLELETLIARRMGRELTMKSLRSRMSTKTNSIKMMLTMRMAITRGVEMVPKRRNEYTQGSDGGHLFSESLLLVFLYTCVLQ
jgi:hypothetical protein